MTFILAFLILLCIIQSVILIFSVRLNLKNADKLESLGEKIEQSLDVLDVCYQRAATRASLEIFSDEPVVRELVDDIRISKDAILLVANLLTEPLKEEDE